MASKINEQDSEEGRNFLDFAPYILLVFRRRKLIASNAVFICIAAAIYAFFIAKLEYNSSISFLPPISGSIALPADLSNEIFFSSQSYDITNDQIAFVFESKDIKRQIIEKFDLYEKYNLSKNKNKFALAVRRLDKNLSLDVLEKGFMGYSKSLNFTISVYAYSPDTALLMSRFAFALLDSAIQSISTERAHRSRIFIESQLTINKLRLDSLQNALEIFQEKTKGIDIPEQIKLSFKTYADIKALVILNELQLQQLKNTFSSELPEMSEIEKNINNYKKKLSSMEKDTTTDVFPTLNKYRTLYPEYSNLMRDIGVENHLVVFLTKELEQARLEEQKNVSDLIITDPPFAPEYKARPTRLRLVMEIIFVYFLAFFFVLIGKEIISCRLKNNCLPKDVQARSDDA